MNTRKSSKSELIIDLTAESTPPPPVRRSTKRRGQKAKTEVHLRPDPPEKKHFKNISCQTKENTPPPCPAREGGSMLGDCPICFDELGTNPVASTCCGHLFCLQCLVQALNVDRHCPTCRLPIRDCKEYYRLYIGNRC